MKFIILSTIAMIGLVSCNADQKLSDEQIQKVHTIIDVINK